MSTAFAHLPIVTNGLIFCVDAANPRSYVSGSTVWNDLSSNSGIVTLTGGTYSSSNSGSIVFDGVDDYGTIPYTSDFDLSGGNYTLEGWFNSNSFSLPQSLIAKDTWGVNFDWTLYIDNATTLSIYSNGTVTNVSATVPTMVPGNWYHYVITSVSNVITIYLNSIPYNSDTMSTSNDSQVYVTVGITAWNNPSWFFNGKIPILRVYKRGLTGAEVSQNYNALKGRFI